MSSLQPPLSLPNQKIMDVLARADRPLSAYDILDKLRRSGVRSPPTVYRALEQLVKRGMAHRIESLNAFVACRHHGEHDSVSSFAICSSCGAVEESAEDASIVKAVAKIGQKFLKTVDHKVIEVTGICRICDAEHAARS
jgi:Fur family zinc uptake transcriptional regulator